MRLTCHWACLISLISYTWATPHNSAYNQSLVGNITHILDNLLSNYNKHFRPGFPGPPLEVTVDVNVLSMGPVSEVDMEFQLDCYFRQYWTDKRLQFTGPLEQLMLNAQKFLNDIWKPDTFITNGRGSYLHKLTVPNRLLRLNGTSGEISTSQRLTLKSRCPMFLRKFPMDTQACPLFISSLGYSTSDVVFKWGAKGVQVSTGAKLSQYALEEIIRGENNRTSVRRNAEDFSTLTVHFLLKRQQGYYIIQIYMPCIMVVSLSWVSFWFNKEASPARVSLGIMTVLTMTTLGLGVRNELPKVSYSTALDQYLFVCFGFVFASLVEYAVINFAHFLYIKKAVAHMRQIAAIAQMRQLAGGMVGRRVSTPPPMTEEGEQTLNADGEDGADDPSMALHTFALHRKSRSGRITFKGPLWSRAYQALRQKLTKPKEKKGGLFSMMREVREANENKAAGREPRLNEDEGEQMKVVDWIDDCAKVLFPLTYLIFNIFYWLSFLYWLPDEIRELPALKMLAESAKAALVAGDHNNSSLLA